MDVLGDVTKARFIAAFVDNILAFGLMIFVIAFIPADFLVLRGIWVVVGFLSYYIIQEAIWSRTLGKYLQGLVVRKLDGSYADLKTSVLRNMTRLLELNPALFGGIPAGIILISSKRKQRWGDMLAGTVVVSDKLVWNSNESSDELTHE